MFSKSKSDEVKVSVYETMASGKQYALNIGMWGNNAASITKGINNHLAKYSNHKVVAMMSSKELGAVVVFEVK